MSQIYIVLFIVYVVIFSTVLLSHLIAKVWQFILNRKLLKFGIQPHRNITKIPFKHLGKPQILVGQALRFFLISSFVALFTLFLFVNSYEILTYTDIPQVNAIEKVPDEEIIKKIVKDMYVHDESADELGRDRKLTVLKVPKIDTRIDLLTKIERNGDWLIRPSSGHYVFLGSDQFNNPEFLLVYFDSNWRTILNPLEIGVGDNIFIQKDNKKDEMFRVKSTSVLKFGDTYIPTVGEKLQMIMFVQDNDSKMNYIFQSEYVDTTLNEFDFLQTR